MFGRIFAASLSGARVCTSCRFRQKLSNEYLLAYIGVDTALKEPLTGDQIPSFTRLLRQHLHPLGQRREQAYGPPLLPRHGSPCRRFGGPALGLGGVE